MLERVGSQPLPPSVVFGSIAEGTVPTAVWLRLSDFHDLSQQRTLMLMIERVKQAVQRHRTGGKPPLVIFDLDDTLFRSNQNRTYRIIREWIAARPNLTPVVRNRLSNVRLEQMGYGARDTFCKAAKLSLRDPVVAAAFADFEAFWKPRFFSSAYVKLDPLQAGAVELATLVHELGANIAYVTGRDEQRMGGGTRTALALSGLPRLSSRVKLFLKPDKDLDDAVFKQGLRKELGRWGDVVAALDNAPANCVAFRKSFPKAMVIFVDTVYDMNASVEVCDGLYRIPGLTLAR